MKIIIKTLLAIALILSSISCRNNQIKEEQTQIAETPEPLQEKKLDFESYGRKSTDLVDELYSDLIENSPELLKLENDLENIDSKPATLKHQLSAFDNKSERYYHSAEYKLSQISDSLLRLRIQSIIVKSKNKYEGNMNEINDLVNSIDKQSTSIYDHHLILKVLLTLPIIEKYQNDNFPSTKEYKELILEQSKLIERISKLSPLK